MSDRYVGEYGLEEVFDSFLDSPARTPRAEDGDLAREKDLLLIPAPRTPYVCGPIGWITTRGGSFKQAHGSGRDGIVRRPPDRHIFRQMTFDELLDNHKMTICAAVGS